MPFAMALGRGSLERSHQYARYVKRNAGGSARHLSALCFRACLGVAQVGIS